MDVIKKMIEMITNEINKKGTCKLNVSIENKDIYLQNTHDLKVVNVDETQETVNLETDLGMTFTIGKNCKQANYNEYENDYQIMYDNNIDMHLALV